MPLEAFILEVEAKPEDLDGNPLSRVVEEAVAEGFRRLRKEGKKAEWTLRSLIFK